MPFRIRPIDTGEIAADKGVYMTLGRGLGEKVKLPATAWLVEDGSKALLVDTGMCDTERADRWHHKGSVQPEGWDIGNRLRALGFSPGDIEAVIFTHLHWDHCSNMKLFVRARFVVHKTELAFARDPIPPYYRSYESPVLGLVPPFEGVEFEEVEGEREVLKGIRVFPTPGHSPGHQSVLIETEAGPYVIAGDAVFCYENLREDPEAHLPVIPIGRYVNMLEMWDSLLKIKEMSRRGAVVLPGHDAAVFRKEVYP